MSHSSRKNRESKRNGFTLIELLVVISIIALLMALILPAVQSARSAARRTQCLNRIRGIGLGIYTFASSSPQGQLPAYGTWGDDTGTSDTSTQPKALKSWVVDILPFVDRRDLFDRWDFEQAHDETGNAALARDYSMRILTCPDDVSAANQPGALSYVVNAGYAGVDAWNSTTEMDRTSGWGNSNGNYHEFGNTKIDWNGNGILEREQTTNNTVEDQEDRNIGRRSGLMWREVTRRSRGRFISKRNFSLSLDEVYDGVGQTILVTENIHAGGQSGQLWGDPDARSCTFVLPIERLTSPPVTYFQNPPVEPLFGDKALINGDRYGIEGRSAFPNSNHSGGVNMTFCDGAARFISEGIDYLVYARLITPAGAQLGGVSTITPQDILSDF